MNLGMMFMVVEHSHLIKLFVMAVRGMSVKRECLYKQQRYDGHEYHQDSIVVIAFTVSVHEVLLITCVL